MNYEELDMCVKNNMIGVLNKNEKERKMFGSGFSRGSLF